MAATAKCKLFFNTSDEDREAFQAILEAQIPCHLAGPVAEEVTPFLTYGQFTLYGIEEIREFIERYRALMKEDDHEGPAQ